MDDAKHRSRSEEVLLEVARLLAAAILRHLISVQVDGPDDSDDKALELPATTVLSVHDG